MAKLQRLELEITRRERWEWRVQRIGWTTVGVVLLAGATGVLGGGGFSRNTVTAPGHAYTVKFERVQRVYAERRIDLQAIPIDGRLTVEIERQSCADIAPHGGTAPSHTEVTTVGQRFVFRAYGRERVGVSLLIQPVRSGACVLTVRANDAQWIELPLFVLP